MPTNPANTTTGLNPGTGGDLMDESLATQPIDTTQTAVTPVQAKRPRVVIGDDSGDLVDLQNVQGVLSLPMTDVTLANKLDRVIQLLLRMDHRLATMSGTLPGE